MEHAQKDKTSKPCSPDFRERAVLLAMEHRDDDQSEAAALTANAGNRAVRRTADPVWMRRVRRDGGERPGPNRAEIAQSEPLRRH